MSYTSSFHHGTDVVIGHNRRDEKHQEEKHIDPDGLHETWIDEPIEEAYERLFGEALKEYNEKQKRSDRKIKSYLQNVRQNSKLNDRYETIVQVGNEKNHPDAETSKTILKEYVEDYKASKQFRADASELVAKNIEKIDIGFYLYRNMQSEDLKKWKELNQFYKTYLKDSYEQYKAQK